MEECKYITTEEGNCVIEERFLAVVKLLLKHGADINAKTKYGDTVLTRATRIGDVEFVNYLIEHGADVKAMTNGMECMDNISKDIHTWLIND